MFKSVLSFVLWTPILLLIFVGLILLFFAMPADFAFATWQNLRLDAKTQGEVVESEVVRGNKGRRKVMVRYEYEVEGVRYSSKRWCAGFVASKLLEPGETGIVRKYEKGEEVAVHYDASNPEFALLAPGWWKWAIGFSLGVWGIALCERFRWRKIDSSRSAFLYAVSRSTLAAGFFALIAGPPVISYALLFAIAQLWGVFLVLLFVVAWSIRVRFAR